MQWRQHQGKVGKVQLSMHSFYCIVQGREGSRDEIPAPPSPIWV